MRINKSQLPDHMYGFLAQKTSRQKRQDFKARLNELIKAGNTVDAVDPDPRNPRDRQQEKRSDSGAQRSLTSEEEPDSPKQGSKIDIHV